MFNIFKKEIKVEEPKTFTDKITDQMSNIELDVNQIATATVATLISTTIATVIPLVAQKAANKKKIDEEDE